MKKPRQTKRTYIVFLSLSTENLTTNYYFTIVVKFSSANAYYARVATVPTPAAAMVVSNDDSSYGWFIV